MINLMAKNKNKVVAGTVKPEAVESEVSPASAVKEVAVDLGLPAWLYDIKVQAIVVAALALVFYWNTFQNESALDDTLLITYNEYVYEGFAGIPDILTNDAYASYYKFMGVGNQLNGGRYRPLSVVNFAVEQQFMGTVPKAAIDSVMRRATVAGPEKDKMVHAMHVRHVWNVLWYAISVVVLLIMLRQVVFRGNHIMAFLAAVLFTIHPLHTEVVANAKSRDEILSLLFICLTVICAFRYQAQKKVWLLIAGLVSYFLAFLSKEYAIGLVVLLPLGFYVLNRETLAKSVVASLPYVGVALLYIGIRSQVVPAGGGDPGGADILNNPYAYAEGSQRMATVIATMLNYLRLLLFPHPLTSDYSYNTIPYKDFAHPLVWLSVGVHGGLVWLMVRYAKQRHVLGFAIAFYLVNLALVCNLFFNIGATMSERLIYHSSVGFCIALGYLLYKGMEAMRSAGKVAVAGLMVMLVVLCGAKTIARNAEWKTNYTLFPADLKVSQNSVMLNAYVGAALYDKAAGEKDEIKKADLHEAIKLFDKAIALDSTYVTAYINRGRSYYGLSEPDSSYANLDAARRLLSNHAQLPELFYNNAVLYINKQQYSKAMNSLQVSLKLNPNYTLSKNAVQQLIAAGVR